MSIKPLHDRVLVERVEGEECTNGGIILPDSAIDRPDEGKVIAIGAGRRNEKGELMPLAVKVGNTVLFGKYCGNDVEVEGKEYLIMREGEILAIIG